MNISLLDKDFGFSAVVDAHSASLRQVKDSVEREREGFAQRLRDRLIAGENTADARAVLDLADHTVALANALAGWCDGVEQGAAAAEVNIATGVSARQAAKELETAMAGLSFSPGPGLEGARAIVHLAADSPDIKVACRALEQAKQRERAAGATLSTAVAEVARIEKRIAEKDGERAAISARRQAGGAVPEDAGALALIDLDRGDLVVELERAKKATIAPKVAHDAAAGEVTAREYDLATATGLAEETAVIAFLNDADNAMRAGIASLDRLHGLRPGGQPRWGASTALRDALRRLAVQRHEA